MMMGPASAKDFVSKYLEKDLPSRLVAYRNHWNLSEEELPLPNTYLTYAPPSLEYMTDELPALYTVIISTKSMTRIGYTETMDPIYTVVYDARTYVWVRDEGMDATARARDNLITVMRTSMLDEQCLLDADTENREVKFDEGTMIEEFSDLLPQKGQRWAAGGYLSYEMTINEIVTRPLIGTVTDFEITNYRFLED